MEDIKIWLEEWFSNNSSKPVEEIREKGDENYFAEGFVDSFGFISLLSDIEEKFGTTFSNDDFLDRSFATVNGLASMINKKKNG